MDLARTQFVDARLFSSKMPQRLYFRRRNLNEGIDDNPFGRRGADIFNPYPWNHSAQVSGGRIGSICTTSSLGFCAVALRARARALVVFPSLIASTARRLASVLRFIWYAM